MAKNSNELIDIDMKLKLLVTFLPQAVLSIWELNKTRL
jgi:hypothetical protein